MLYQCLCFIAAYFRTSRAVTSNCKIGVSVTFLPKKFYLTIKIILHHTMFSEPYLWQIVASIVPDKNQATRLQNVSYIVHGFSPFGWVEC